MSAMMVIIISIIAGAGAIAFITLFKLIYKLLSRL